MPYVDLAVVVLWIVSLFSSVWLICTDWPLFHRRQAVMCDVSSYTCLICSVYLVVRLMTQGALI